MTKYDKKIVTINDVAREAGVSISTVSRVLNNNYPVKQETRENIERAIEKLQYNPNTIARGLAMKKTLVIGIVVPGLTNLFFPMTVEAIDSVIKKKNYSISLNNSSGNPELERGLINKMISMQVDGIISIDPAAENLDNGFYESISTKLPVIIVNANSNRENLNFISYNEEIGTLEGFEYLVSLGHKRIAFLRGESSFSYDVKEKVYSNIIDKYGLSYNRIIKIEHGNTINSIEEAKNAVYDLLKSKEKPSSIFACNELMAVGVLDACNDIGIGVPKDLSIIGFDNTLISKISYPKLTTIDLGMNNIGTRAAQEILRLIDNGKTGRTKVVMETKLIIRDSCSSCNES